MYYYELITYPLFIAAIIFSLYAQLKISSTYKKYSRFYTRAGRNATDIARMMLSDAGVYDVSIGRVRGNLTDHFDPRSNTLALSDTTYASTSAAAIGVAAHEAGHAIQYAKNYAPIKLRAGLVKVTNIGSALSMPLFFIGLIFAYYPLTILGIILYSLVTLFQLVTLPVEFNASSRAMAVLESSGILNQDELYASRKVLDAAAMTYVAALLTSLLTLLRLLILANGRRR